MFLKYFEKQFTFLFIFSPGELCNRMLESDRGKFVVGVDTALPAKERQPTIGATGILNNSGWLS
jgi:hypothetical protein